MKKVLAMLIALVMVLALCACGDQGTSYAPPVGESGTNAGNNGGNATGDDNSGEKKETIVGKWTGEIDLMDILLLSGEIDPDEMDEATKEVVLPEDLTMTFTMEFDEDGKATMTLDGEDAIKAWKEQICGNMVKYLRKELEAAGITEEAFEKSAGMTLKEYVEETVIGEMSIDDDQFKFSESGEYKLEEGKLYFDEDGEFEDYFTVDLDGDELTFEEYSEDWEDVEFMKDLTLKRK